MTETTQAQASQEGEKIILMLWDDVIKTVNRLLDAHVKFGFNKIQASLNPSLEAILHGLGFVDFALTAIMNTEHLEHDALRQALNSKQCVLHIKSLAAALEGGDEEEYKAAIRALDTQAKF